MNDEIYQHEAELGWNVDIEEIDCLGPLDELTSLAETIVYVYEDFENFIPHQTEYWRAWRDKLLHLLRGIRKSRAPDVLAVAGVAEALGNTLMNLMGKATYLEEKYHNVCRQVAELGRGKRLEEVEVMRSKGVEHPEQLAIRVRTARQGLTKAKVVIPAQTVTVRSLTQQEIIHTIGQLGLGRSWRIIERVVPISGVKENSVRNAMNKLTKKGLVDDYRRGGKPVRWKPTVGGSRRLVMLTDKGEAWYQEAFGKEPIESEILGAVRQHRSAAHGVGILEAADHLRVAGYEVDDSPDAILAQDQDRWGKRQEPDLAVWMDGNLWPVEVQREVSERRLEKWERAILLTERLVLVLFNEEHRKRQECLLYKDTRLRRLRRGTIYLASLEKMETEYWDWAVLNLPIRY